MCEQSSVRPAAPATRAEHPLLRPLPGARGRGEMSGSDGVFQRRSESRHGEVAEQQEAGLPAAAHGNGGQEHPVL